MTYKLTISGKLPNLNDFIKADKINRYKGGDLDNISSFGRKVIQDALVKTKVLQNDGWSNIIGFCDSFSVDKDNPRIEIEIEEKGL